MRLPFPERIPLLFSLLFAVVLITVQQLQGSDLFFSAGCFVFIVVATIAFNTAGGFSRPSGAYIFFNAVLTVIIGIVYKAYLGEQAQSNLLVPRQTIGIYDLGMAGMLVAAYLSRRFSTKEGLLQDTLPANKMQGAVYGCIVLSIVLRLINQFVPGGEAGFMSAINQLDRFMPMAILLGVTHQVRKSGGRSSLNPSVIFAIAWIFITSGLLPYSKEGMFTPFACWLIAAASVRYRFSIYQLSAIVLGCAFIFYYLVPYSQYGRNFRGVDATIGQQVQRSIYLLTHPGEVQANNADQPINDSWNDLTVNEYFNHPQGLFDRLQMLSIDDALIAYTEEGHVYGFSPLLFSLENVVPRAIWKNKPTIIYGNIYAHEIGVLTNDEDTSTGISFSPVADSWHMGRWVGLLIIAPLLWLLLFVVFDSLAGSVRKAPWGLLATVSFAHIAPEGMIGFVFYTVTYGALAMLFVAFFAAYVMPILGTFIIGPGRTVLTRPGRIQSIPRRVGSA